MMITENRDFLHEGKIDDAAKEKGEKMGKSVEDVAGRVAHRVGDYSQRVIDFVRNRPWASVGITAVLAFVLGKLMG